MPQMSVYAIRLSFIYFIAGITAGLFMLVSKVLPLDFSFYVLLPVHIELMVFGWILNFVMGVAFWIFPRFYKKPVRGNTMMNFTGFYIFNIAVLLVIADELFIHIAFLLLAGNIIEVVGICLFFITLWSRVFRPSATHE